MRVTEVHLPPADLRRLASLVGQEHSDRFMGAVAEPTVAEFAGSSLLNVSSTATGGGVAEMLRVLMPYIRGTGLDARWLVIEGDPAFFAITKRIHNHLYGEPGDGGPLGEAEHRHYTEVLRGNASEIAALVKPSDVVILHDPQTAGLTEGLARRGVTVLWRCHVGIDQPNEHSERAWAFLRRYLEPPLVAGFVFTRRAFAPSWVPDPLLHVIPPSIDPFSPKNEPMDDDAVRAVLATVGLVAGPATGSPVFRRSDGSAGRVDHCADLIHSGPAVPPDAPLVVQVSRWDRLKDMAGVMVGFADLVAEDHGAHLVLAGPVVSAVTDDPEGAEVLLECFGTWRQLPHAVRSRVTLACLPMTDLDENAAIVNALQRRASVVVQKSLAEGFGLTVAEAMFKSRPVIGSAVGGIVDQVVDGETGILLPDPSDLDAFGHALFSLLDQPERMRAMGDAARQRTIDEFLPDRHLERWAKVLAASRAG